MTVKRIIVKKENGVITVRAGKYMESFDISHMSQAEIIDHVYWIGVTGSVVLSMATIEDLLRENRVLP
jgi:hypothetical protein